MVGDLHRAPADELVFRIIEDVTESCVYLGITMVQSHDGHADWRFFENLSEILLTCFERRGPVSDEPHLANAAQTRDNQESIFEYDPTTVLQ